jgi:hypothetical protein
MPSSPKALLGERKVARELAAVHAVQYRLPQAHRHTRQASRCTKHACTRMARRNNQCKALSMCACGPLRKGVAAVPTSRASAPCVQTQDGPNSTASHSPCNRGGYFNAHDDKKRNNPHLGFSSPKLAHGAAKQPVVHTRGKARAGA